MAEAQRRIVRTIPPPPPEFREQFVLGGWRQVERVYGARTSLIRKWIKMTGADEARKLTIKGNHDGRQGR